VTYRRKVGWFTVSIARDIVQELWQVSPNEAGAPSHT